MAEPAAGEKPVAGDKIASGDKPAAGEKPVTGDKMAANGVSAARASESANATLRTEIKQLRDTLAEMRQTPKAVPLQDLTKTDIESFRKVRDAIRGELGIQDHPLLRRRATRQLALVNLLLAHMDDDEDEEGEEDEGDEDGTLGSAGKLMMARRIRRRGAARRLALIRLVANDEDDD